MSSQGCCPRECIIIVGIVCGDPPLYLRTQSQLYVFHRSKAAAKGI